MRNLAVSNIAWTGNNEQVFEFLANLGVKGIEVAPGKVAGGWDSLDLAVMGKYRSLCERFDLVIPSFQAFLFGKPELQLLSEANEFNKLVEHMKFVAELAQTAGAKILVYGAPKNRMLLGNTAETAFKLAQDRLAILSQTCWQYGVSIGLEAVPDIYGGEIIKSYQESLAIVKTVNHPGLVFHLDAGCTFLNDDSVVNAIDDAADMIKHFHISQPKLTTFINPEQYHQDAANSLKKQSYKHWKCIEMLETTNALHDIQNAVQFVKDNY